MKTGATSRFSIVAALLSVAGSFGCGTAPMRADLDDVALQRAELKRQSTADTAARDQLELRMALSLYRAGDSTAARDKLESALRRNPQHRSARLALADLLAEQQEFAVAENHLAELLATDPDDAAGHHAMGLLKQEMGDTERARYHLAQACRLAPGNRVFAKAQRALVGSPRRAAANPASVGVAIPRPQVSGSGVALASLTQPAPTAAASISRNSAVTPMAPAAASKADAAAAAKRLHAVAKNETAAAEIAKALRAAQAGRPDAALTALVKAAEAEPDNPHIPTEGAIWFMRSGQTPAAIHLLLSTARRHPRSASLYRALGSAYFQQKAYKRAANALRRSLSLDSSNGLTYFLLGHALQKLGHVSEAERKFDRAAWLDPRFAR